MHKANQASSTNLALGTPPAHAHLPLHTLPQHLSQNLAQCTRGHPHHTCQHPSPQTRTHAPFRNLVYQNDTPAQLVHCHTLRDPCLYLQRECSMLLWCERAYGDNIRSAVRSVMCANNLGLGHTWATWSLPPRSQRPRQPHPPPLGVEATAP